MIRKIKVSTSMEFDECTEKDILNGISEFTSRRQLGALIEGAIRLVYNHPNEAKILGFPFNTDIERDKFFKETNRKVEELTRKVDKIYEQMLMVIIAQKFGRGLALEGKASNVLEASIELERQIKDLSETFGLPAGAKMFSRNGLPDVDGEAQVVVDFITENYRGFVESLVGDLRVTPQVIYAQPIQASDSIDTVQNKAVGHNAKKETRSTNRESSNKDNEAFLDDLLAELGGDSEDDRASQKKSTDKFEFSLDDDIEEPDRKKEESNMDFGALATFMGMKG